MGVNEYFSLKKQITKYCRKCTNECPLSIVNNGKAVNCTTLELDFPELASELLKNYVEKKEGFITCMKDLQKQLTSKCNKYESCTECRNANK